jgi:xylan 1,4-beta-xylosidase
MPLWWTEWGVSPRDGAAINDSAWAAPLVARGMRSAAGRLEALAYWVASDHFVEGGDATQ